MRVPYWNTRQRSPGGMGPRDADPQRGCRGPRDSLGRPKIIRGLGGVSVRREKSFFRRGPEKGRRYDERGAPGSAGLGRRLVALDGCRGRVDEIVVLVWHPLVVSAESAGNRMDLHNPHLSFDIQARGCPHPVGNAHRLAFVRPDRHVRWADLCRCGSGPLNRFADGSSGR